MLISKVCYTFFVKPCIVVAFKLRCLAQVSKIFCLMDISGAMGLFEKLDVGPLELGDYLGWIYTCYLILLFVD